MLSLRKDVRRSPPRDTLWHDGHDPPYVDFDWRILILNPLTTNQRPQMSESRSTAGMDYRHTVYDYGAVN